jgi:uncharacterized glyoxalase superfamily protein PhnB
MAGNEIRLRAAFHDKASKGLDIVNGARPKVQLRVRPNNPARWCIGSRRSTPVYPRRMAKAASDVIPLIACADIAAEHDFLVDVLGFAPVDLERTPDGRIVHAEVRIGDRRIWIHPVNTGELEPPGRGPSHGGLVVQVPDVDDHYERARAAGADIIYEPREQEYGQREYGLRDPEGHLWWIGTPTRTPAMRRLGNDGR